LEIDWVTVEELAEQDRRSTSRHGPNGLTNRCQCG
jgi:hypothetical protein